MAVSGLALSPAFGQILNLRGHGISLNSIGNVGSFTPASADPDIAASFKLNALIGNSSFRFTPAGQTGSSKRSVTIMVRQQTSATNAVNIRENILNAPVGASESLPMKLTPTTYSLGSAKGWKNFALPVRDLGGNLPDLASLGAAKKFDADRDAGNKSRFNTKLKMDAKTPIGSAPRALDESQKDVMIDVGGSFALTRNLDVTAGVRYQNERDRLAPLTDARQDSQAVYVGTQFRF